MTWRRTTASNSASWLVRIWCDQWISNSWISSLVAHLNHPWHVSRTESCHVCLVRISRDWFMRDMNHSYGPRENKSDDELRLQQWFVTHSYVTRLIHTWRDSLASITYDFNTRAHPQLCLLFFVSCPLHFYLTLLGATTAMHIALHT